MEEVGDMQVRNVRLNEISRKKRRKRKEGRKGGGKKKGRMSDTYLFARHEPKIGISISIPGRKA